MIGCKIALQHIFRRNFSHMRSISKLTIIIMVFLLFTMMTSAEASRHIAYDEAITGELDSQVYEQFYTFDGQAGDTILIQMRATSEDPRLDSYLYLRDAQGNELAVDDDAGGNLNSLIGPYMLEESGVYTIVATRFMQADGTSSGAYELSVILADYETIATDERVQVELDAINYVKFYTFTANEAGLYEVRYSLLSGEGGTELAMRNPQGDYITSISVDRNIGSNFVVMQLDAGQKVNILARHLTGYDGNGQVLEAMQAIELEFSIVAVETEPLSFDVNAPVSISSTLEGFRSVDYYSFNAVVGQTLSIIGSTTDDANIELYVVMLEGLMGFHGGTAYIDGDVIVPAQIITQTGEFSLVVHRNIIPADVDENEPINYSLMLTIGETPQLEPGVAVEGSVDTATGQYEDAYLYEGRAGETITFNLTHVDDNYEPAFSIELAPQDMMREGQNGFYANFGSSIGGNISYDVTLPRDATYIIRIYDGFYQPEDQPGTYRLLLESN